MYKKAYAKINIYLDVVGKRDDGYHVLDMVMLPLELHDSIELNDVPYLKDSYVTCDKVELKETKYNLINKTLSEMRKRYGIKKNFAITVHKEIPISAGMGGGSSNAAAVIKALKTMCKIELSPEEELDLALSLGADVPYCLINKPSHVTGIGETVEPIKLKKQFFVLVIKPELGLSTKTVFEKADNVELEHGNVNDVIKALETGDEDLLAKSAFNSLEKVAIEMVPQIKEIKNMLHKDGFKTVLMTGSGSCVFALTTDFWNAFKRFRDYEKKGFDVYLSKTLTNAK